MNRKSYAIRSVLSQQSQSGESQPISVADAEKAAHIRWCYQTGLEFLQYPANAAGRAGIRESAQGKGIPVAVARRYSQFASEYTEEEVEALIAACIAANFVFSFSHFRVLLGVADPSVRTELAMRAIREKLGTVRIRRLKERLVSNPAAQGGRKSQLLKLDPTEMEWIINRDIEKLARHLRQVLSQSREMHPRLRKRLQKVLACLQ